MNKLISSPTRMELSRLKKQLQLSERGHKLLKDKQDELMRQFISIVKETQSLRANVQKRYRAVRRRALLAKSSFDAKEVSASYLKTDSSYEVTVRQKNQMGVIVPVMDFGKRDVQDIKILELSPELSETRREMSELFPDLFRLAQMEKHCVMLSSEIEKTRRRVNALEYMTIPQLKETIRFIKMRLEDSERDRITRLIKMQDYEITAQ